ncbi:unnamed protein product [Oikopleura dioica]|uniref:Wiskott-Aldrich syndrome protein family member n=1 Tax=Oikopleura dioica TaxID=34765 RepID=E4YB76_OIKDI|nr:unnamed protein product [Oikopleura dioica]
MPLVRRSIQPQDLCRKKLPEHVESELEMVTNNALCGVISQLSDLSRHAENLFQELSLEANNFTDRARELEERVVDLSQRLSIDRNNNTEWQLRNRDIQFDRYIMARDTIPQSLKEVYDTADAPPALEKLQKYRDDGKNCLKMYTNPDYFYLIWREKIQAENDADRKRKRDERERKKQQLKIQKNKQPENPKPASRPYFDKNQERARGKELTKSIRIANDSQSNRRGSQQNLSSNYMDTLPRKKNSNAKKPQSTTNLSHQSSMSSEISKMSIRSTSSTSKIRNQTQPSFPQPPAEPTAPSGFPLPPASGAWPQPPAGFPQAPSPSLLISGHLRTGGMPIGMTHLPSVAPQGPPAPPGGAPPPPPPPGMAPPPGPGTGPPPPPGPGAPPPAPAPATKAMVCYFIS